MKVAPYQQIAMFLMMSISLSLTASAPTSYNRAKSIIYRIARDINNYTIYCNCPIVWINKKKNFLGLATCGYRGRKQKKRGNRIEIEHIVPVRELAHHMPCWKKGGRKGCAKNRKYNMMANDLHNLWPVIDEVSSDRSHYPFGIITGPSVSYGQCDMRISLRDKIAEPPERVKGFVARTYLYMLDKYKFKLSAKQKKLYQTWDSLYSMQPWEIQREEVLSEYMQSGIG